MELHTISSGELDQIDGSNFILKVPIQFQLSENETPTLSEVIIKSCTPKISEIDVHPDGDVSIHPSIDHSNETAPLRYPIIIRPDDSSNINKLFFHIPIQVSEEYKLLNSSFELDVLLDFVFKGICPTKFKLTLTVNPKNNKFSAIIKRTDNRLIFVINILLVIAIIFGLRTWNQNFNNNIYVKYEIISYKNISDFIVFLYGFLGLQIANFLPSVLNLRRLSDMYNFPELYFSPTLLFFYKKKFSILFHSCILLSIVAISLVTRPISLHNITDDFSDDISTDLLWIDNKGITINEQTRIPLYLFYLKEKLNNDLFSFNCYKVAKVKNNGTYQNRYIGEAKYSSKSTLFNPSIELKPKKYALKIGTSCQYILREYLQEFTECEDFFEESSDNTFVLNNTLQLLNNKCIHPFKKSIVDYFNNVDDKTERINIQFVDNSLFAKNKSIFTNDQFNKLVFAHKSEMETLSLGDIADIITENYDINKSKDFFKTTHYSYHELKFNQGQPIISSDDIVKLSINFKSVAEKKAMPRAKHLAVMISIFNYYKNNKHIGQIDISAVEDIVKSYTNYFNGDVIKESNFGIDNWHIHRLYNRFLIDLEMFLNQDNINTIINTSIFTIFDRTNSSKSRNIYNSYMKDLMICYNKSKKNSIQTANLHDHFNKFYTLAKRVNKGTWHKQLLLENSIHFNDYINWYRTVENTL